MASPYLNAGTDGTDPGLHYANWLRQVTIARTGDRRGATRTLYSGSYEGAAYPVNYNSLTVAVPFGTTHTVTGTGSGSNLQAKLNAAVVGDVIEITAGAAAGIIGNFTLPAKTGADTLPGGN